MMRGPFVAVMWRTLAFLCVSLLFFSACSSDDAYTVYSRYKASFTYDRVMTTTPLKNALTGPGEFCTISLIPKQLVFQSLNMSQKVDITAAAAYQKFVSIQNHGFIVGLPNSIELGHDYFSIVCFDIVCSNCYKEEYITRDLTLQEGGFAYCSRCKRRYNLNNLGIVEGLPAGKPLERYRIAYDSMNRMTITN